MLQEFRHSYEEEEKGAHRETAQRSSFDVHPRASLRDVLMSKLGPESNEPHNVSHGEHKLSGESQTSLQSGTERRSSLLGMIKNFGSKIARGVHSARGTRSSFAATDADGLKASPPLASQALTS